MTVPQTQLLNLLSEGLIETLKDQNKVQETCLFREKYVHIYRNESNYSNKISFLAFEFYGIQYLTIFPGKEGCSNY